MPPTRDIRIRFTPLQYEIVKNKAQIGGHRSIAAYIRDIILKPDFSMEKLIRELHTMVVKEQNLPKKPSVKSQAYDES